MERKYHCAVFLGKDDLAVRHEWATYVNYPAIRRIFPVVRQAGVSCTWNY